MGRDSAAAAGVGTSDGGDGAWMGNMGRGTGYGDGAWAEVDRLGRNGAGTGGGGTPPLQ